MHLHVVSKIKTYEFTFRHRNGEITDRLGAEGVSYGIVPLSHLVNVVLRIGREKYNFSI